jgi:hypothetical protein
MTEKSDGWLESYLENFRHWEKEFGWKGKFLSWADLDEAKAIDPKLVWTIYIGEPSSGSTTWATNGLDLTLANSKDPTAGTFLVCTIPWGAGPGTQFIALDYEGECGSCEAGESEDAEDCEDCYGEGYRYWEFGAEN